MRRAVTVLALLALAASPALASRTIVPDQHPTIQLGVDSGVDTVIVRPGDYPEVVTTNRGVVLMGMVPSVAPGGFAGYDRPAVLGLSSSRSIELHNLRFRSSLALITGAFDSALVVGCRVDGSLDIGYRAYARAQSSIVFGDLKLRAHRGDIQMNTLVGGGMFVSVASFTSVYDNVVLGPADIGIDANCDASIRGDYVRGCVTGIRGGCDGLHGVEGNVVEDCSGDGYKLGWTPTAVINNIARRCGGRGFDIDGSLTEVTGNVAEDTGTEGMRITGVAGTVADNTMVRAAGVGLHVAFAGRGVYDNRVLAAGGDGLVISNVLGSQPLFGNVVGRAAGRGIVVAAAAGGPILLSRNTSFSNAASGIDVLASGTPVDSITNNISFGNAVGLAWSGPSTPFLGCNDWFANSGGAVTGTAVGATDVAVDPQFCDLPNDLVSLAAGSPLANLAGCGQVGALGVACAVAVGVGDQRPATLGRLRIQPQPSQGAMSFAFDASDAATTLEVYDVTGARRMARTLAPRTAGYAWNGTDDSGQPLPAGVYFAKLVQSAARSEATVVVIR